MTRSVTVSNPSSWSVVLAVVAVISPIVARMNGPLRGLSDEPGVRTEADEKPCTSTVNPEG